MQYNKELILTEEEKYTLLNLIEAEFNIINNLPYNINKLTESYRQELHRIHKKIVNNLADEDEE